MSNTIPEEIEKAIKDYSVGGSNPCAVRSDAIFGYSLAQGEIATLEQTISDQDKRIVEQRKEIERVKGLLREVCVRANIIFAEEVEEIEMFEEQFAGQGDLLINIGATLGLGEIDKKSKTDNERRLKLIQEQFKPKL